MDTDALILLGCRACQKFLPQLPERDVPVTEPQTPHASVQSPALQMEAAVEEQISESSTGMLESASRK